MNRDSDWPRFEQAMVLQARGAYARAWRLYEGLTSFQSDALYWLLLALLAEQTGARDQIAPCLNAFQAALKKESAFFSLTRMPVALVYPTVQLLLCHLPHQLQGLKDALSTAVNADLGTSVPTQQRVKNAIVQAYFLLTINLAMQHLQKTEPSVVHLFERFIEQTLKALQTVSSDESLVELAAFCLGKVFMYLAEAQVLEGNLRAALQAVQQSLCYLSDLTQRAGALDLAARLHLNLLQQPEAKAAFLAAYRCVPTVFRQLQLALCHLPLQYGSTGIAQAQRLKKELQSLEQVPVFIEEMLPQTRHGCFTLFHWNYTIDNDASLRSAYASRFCWQTPLPALPVPAPSAPQKLGFMVTPGQEGLFVFSNQALLAQLTAKDIPLEVHLFCFAEHPLLQKLRAELPELQIHQLNADYTHPQFVLQCQQVRSMGLQWMYFWEVGTDTLNFLLPYYRWAPVQFTSWGSVSSTGHPAIDGFLATETLVPSNKAAQQLFSETLIRHKTTLFSCSEQDFLPLMPTIQKAVSANTVRVACLHNPRKNSPQFLRALKHILERVQAVQTQHKQGVTVFMVESAHAHWQANFEAQVQDALGDCYGAIEWLPRRSSKAFLSFLNTMDLMLDPFPFGAGKLAFESVLCALPVVSLWSDQLRGRIVSVCYQEMGINLDNTTAEQYVEAACRLITDTEFRQHQKQKLLQARQTLINRPIGKDFYNALRDRVQNRLSPC